MWHTHPTLLVIKHSWQMQNFTLYLLSSEQIYILVPISWINSSSYAMKTREPKPYEDKEYFYGVSCTQGEKLFEVSLPNTLHLQGYYWCHFHTERWANSILNLIISQYPILHKMENFQIEYRHWLFCSFLLALRSPLALFYGVSSC